MAELIWSTEPAEAAGWPAAGGAPAFVPAVVARHRPDAHAQWVEAGRRSGQVSVWWTEAPPLAGEKLGAIGHFGAMDETAAQALLEAALARLREAGCTLAVGPMDGNTWRRYRFVTERGTEPPFILEPWNPPEWPEWWRRAGFAPLAHYTSALAEAPVADDPKVIAQERKLQAAGIALRPIDLAQFDQELERIYAVSAVGFQQAYLYTPLPRADFLAQYAAVRPLVRPEFVYLAERAGETIGFMFALPDLLERQRGAAPATLIAKTIAVRPEYAGLGLGTVLFAKVHTAARAAGLRRVMHALMHETNLSRRLSAHHGHTLRGYTLFSRRLGP